MKITIDIPDALMIRAKKRAADLRRPVVAEHQASRQAIETAFRNDSGWGITTATLTEFWCVTTHPRCSGGPAQPAHARMFITKLLEDGDGVAWQPSPDFGLRLLQLRRS